MEEESCFTIQPLIPDPRLAPKTSIRWSPALVAVTGRFSRNSGGYLDDHPEVWHQSGDLARHARELWVDLIAGTDLIARESLIRKAAALGTDLAGPSPSPLEQLLVERVVACWLQVDHGDASVALGKDISLRQAAFAEKRQTAAHRRYLSALGALAMVRRLIPAATEPAGSLPQPEVILDSSGNTAPQPEPNDSDGGDFVDPARSIPLQVFGPFSGRSGNGGDGQPSRMKQVTSAS